jgi:mannosyl-3-phosphoglycerate phosphatase
MMEPWVIITDFYGLFLDVEEGAGRILRPAFRSLQKAGLPIVFCSSKTREEILQVRRELKLHDPFIVENGGAIYFEEGYFPFPVDAATRRGNLLTLSLGKPYTELVKAIESMEQETGYRIERFGRADNEVLAHVTGYSLRQVELAKQREFDEPFWFSSNDPAQRKTFLRKLRRLPSIRVTRGARFYHLKGVSDKGSAVEQLKVLYRRLWPSVRFIGVGGNVNDIPLLRVVDVPILLRRADGSFNREVAAAVPHAMPSPVAPPLGWAAAVLPLVSPGPQETAVIPVP